MPPQQITNTPIGRVDQSQWRESNVGDEERICKSKALGEYKLREKDLEGLQFYKAKIMNLKGFKVDTYLYREIEVERRAWERYGGPQAFEAVLQRKYEEHLQKPRPRKHFVRPAQYGHGKLTGKRAPRDRPPPRTDPYIKRSRSLWQIRDAMPAWLWEACNEELNVQDAAAQLSSSSSSSSAGTRTRTKKVKARFDTDKKREAALSLVLALPLFKSGVYSARPADLMPLSPAVEAFREVLSAAPRLPDIPGMHVKGLAVERHAGETSGGDLYVYEWDRRYLDSLWRASYEVARVHGTGAEGWGIAKWEVYDTFVETMGGIVFVADDDGGAGAWCDAASQWLEDGLVRAGFRREAMPIVQISM
ncbi:hypothetical protein C8Q80DRAFT_214900 [Daedaleopsis nitida]|nr:hypothetical protein C8Q80DRAFT_214900 [Daedaleopsis nitida]